MEVDEAADGLDEALLGVDGQVPQAADRPCLLPELADSAGGRGSWLRVPRCRRVLWHSSQSKASLRHYPTKRPALPPGVPCGTMAPLPRLCRILRHNAELRAIRTGSRE